MLKGHSHGLDVTADGGCRAYASLRPFNLTDDLQALLKSIISPSFASSGGQRRFGSEHDVVKPKALVIR
ncbi:hypothetical protein CO675_26460 [Bradyrhizobium sp. C9]|nr:hypothetical protein CO675_26460 [Bradyrhizobium sp. C9]